jgi:hypothetical protein
MLPQCPRHCSPPSNRRRLSGRPFRRVRPSPTSCLDPGRCGRVRGRSGCLGPVVHGHGANLHGGARNRSVQIHGIEWVGFKTVIERSCSSGVSRRFSSNGPSAALPASLTEQLHSASSGESNFSKPTRLPSSGVILMSRRRGPAFMQETICGDSSLHRVFARLSPHGKFGHRRACRTLASVGRRLHFQSCC